MLNTSTFSQVGPGDPVAVATDRPPFRPATVMVVLLTVFFVLYAITAMMAGFSEHAQIGLLEQMAAGVEISTSELFANDLRQGLIALLQLALLLALVITYCMWVFRANKNARALGAEGMRFSAGWCVGWFFVPIMWLFKPYQAVQEIYRASDPEASPTDWPTRPVAGILPLWWTAWLISGILGQVSFRMSLTSESIDSLISASWVALVGYGIDIPLSVLALAVVRSIHDRQELKHRRGDQQPMPDQIHPGALAA